MENLKLRHVTGRTGRQADSRVETPNWYFSFNIQSYFDYGLNSNSLEFRKRKTTLFQACIIQTWNFATTKKSNLCQAWGEIKIKKRIILSQAQGEIKIQIKKLLKKKK